MSGLWKKYRKIIFGLIAVAAILTAAFVWGGKYPEATADQGASSAAPATALEQAEETDHTATTDAGTTKAGNAAATEDSASETENDGATDQDAYHTDPVPADKPLPVEPDAAGATGEALSCTLSVRCDTILDNMDLLAEEKWELVPEDGVIFAATTVAFYENESVFNVLQREMKKAGIQMEFTNTPIYNSAYIESINNLYEFDVGELSGWAYRVNGWFPNYGCSRYQIQDGDLIEWIYTCDLGRDIGGYNSFE